MGAVVNFSFKQFVDAVTAKLDNESKGFVQKHNSRLESIFNQAAANDDGVDDAVFESDANSFNTLVETGVNFINTLRSINSMFGKMRAQIVKNGMQTGVDANDNSQNAE